MERDLLRQEIIRKLKEGNVMMIAPMGWGKTTMMLQIAVELAREGKVGLFAPTLTLLIK